MTARECRTPLCAGEPVSWVEWAKPGETPSREDKPICSACAAHLMRYAERKGLRRFLVLVPLEQAKFPF